jgi:hypothetical protein
MGETFNVTISWREYVHPQLNTFCTMPSLAYDLRENPLYQVLESKADQLRGVPDDVHRGIFIGDAGCQLFSDIYRVDRVNHTFSGQQVIEAFLASESTIDFVAVFSVKRANTGSWDSSKNPRIWYVYLFEQKKPRERLDLSRVMGLRDVLPDPFRGQTEFPLMGVACTPALAQDRAFHLWVLSKPPPAMVRTASLALGEIPSEVDPSAETAKMGINCSERKIPRHHTYLPYK